MKPLVGIAIAMLMLLTLAVQPSAVEAQAPSLVWHWLEPSVQVVNLDNITSSTGFVDVDVTANTSATTSFIMLRMYAAGGYGSATNTWINTRKNGQSDSGVSWVIPPALDDWIPMQQMWITAVDAGQIFEYKLDPGTGAAIYLDYFVHAYMDEAATPTPTNTPTASHTPAVVGTPHIVGEVTYGDLGRQTVLLYILGVLVIWFICWLVRRAFAKPRGK